MPRRSNTDPALCHLPLGPTYLRDGYQTSRLSPEEEMLTLSRGSRDFCWST